MTTIQDLLNKYQQKLENTSPFAKSNAAIYQEIIDDLEYFENQSAAEQLETGENSNHIGTINHFKGDLKSVTQSENEKLIKKIIDNLILENPSKFEFNPNKSLTGNQVDPVKFIPKNADQYLKPRQDMIKNLVAKINSDQQKQFYQQLLSDGIYQDNKNDKIFSMHFSADGYYIFLRFARQAFKKVYSPDALKYILAIHPETAAQLDLERLKRDVSKFTDTSTRDAFFPSEESQQEEAEKITIQVNIDDQMPFNNLGLDLGLEGWMIRIDKKYKIVLEEVKK